MRTPEVKAGHEAPQAPAARERLDALQREHAAHVEATAAAEAEHARLTAEIAAADPEVPGFEKLVARRATAQARAEAYRGRAAACQARIVEVAAEVRHAALAETEKALDALAVRADAHDRTMTKATLAYLAAMRGRHDEARALAEEAGGILRTLAELRGETFDVGTVTVFSNQHLRWLHRKRLVALHDLESVATE
jgi:hypothetical protein